jgi:hypothetical protein
MRYRFCKHCGALHGLSEWPMECQEETASSAPYVISDNIEIQSMHDGQHYTSKSRLRGEYRAHGIEEIGNDMPRPKAPTVDREGIRNDLRRVYAEYNS